MPTLAIFQLYHGIYKFSSFKKVLPESTKVQYYNFFIYVKYNTSKLEIKSHSYIQPISRKTKLNIWVHNLCSDMYIQSSDWLIFKSW
jgi:hypothetical protein